MFGEVTKNFDSKVNKKKNIVESYKNAKLKM